MRLWTIHNNQGFSLTEGKVDHSKSEYYASIPAVREAYPKLWRHLGVDDGQIIWCYTRTEDIPVTSIPRHMWELEAPESSILTYIDDVTWNRLLGIRVRLTPRYTEAIREDAAKKFPHDPQARRQHEIESEKRWWDHKPPESTLWRELFLDKPVDGSPALLRHPIQKEWIVDCRVLRCS